MPNHFHLVVETPQPNLVAGMKWLLGTYTSRFNRRHKLFGHLFSGQNLTQRRSGESSVGGAVACGDDDNGRVDCGASGHGNARPSEPPVVSTEEGGSRVVVIKN
jgi:hypothetical protein